MLWWHPWRWFNQEEIKWMRIIRQMDGKEERNEIFSICTTWWAVQHNAIHFPIKVTAVIAAFSAPGSPSMPSTGKIFFVISLIFFFFCLGLFFVKYFFNQLLLYINAFFQRFLFFVDDCRSFFKKNFLSCWNPRRRRRYCCCSPNQLRGNGSFRHWNFSLLRFYICVVVVVISPLKKKRIR